MRPRRAPLLRSRRRPHVRATPAPPRPKRGAVPRAAPRDLEDRLARAISAVTQTTTDFDREARVTAPYPTVHRWRAFAVLAASYFMTIIDLTIVNVALPTIGRELHFSETNLQWVVTAYAL